MFKTFSLLFKAASPPGTCLVLAQHLESLVSDKPVHLTHLFSPMTYGCPQCFQGADGSWIFYFFSLSFSGVWVFVITLLSRRARCVICDYTTLGWTLKRSTRLEDHLVFYIHLIRVYVSRPSLLRLCFAYFWGTQFFSSLCIGTRRDAALGFTAGVCPCACTCR